MVLVGVLGQYNGTAQMKNADITSFTTTTTIPAVLESVKDFEKNQYTDNKVVISGEVTEVQNATYGNVVIKDADGNSILVYGLYSATGATRYDKMDKAPAVGDTITVLGIVGKYNDAQMKNGWLIAHTVAHTCSEWDDATCETPKTCKGCGKTEGEALNHNYVDGVCDREGCGAVEPTGPVEVTLTEAIALEDGTDVIVKGTVKKIDTAWSEQYGNITVTIEDADGNTLYIYRLKTNVQVGDVVTITGKVGSYNGAKQIAAGATAVIETAE